MSLLEQIRKRGETKRENELTFENVSLQPEALEKENITNDTTQTEQGEKPPPTPPPMNVISPSTSIDTRQSLLSSIQNPIINLKKTVIEPKTTPVQLNMMDQILLRQSQLKNKEKFESQVAIPKSKKEVFVTSEAPKELINESEILPKWHQRLFKKGIYLCYITLDQKKFSIMISGCSYRKDSVKIDTEMKSIMNDAVGYSLYNSVKWFDDLVSLFEGILESDHFKKLYILHPDFKPEKSITFSNWIVDVLRCFNRVYIRNRRFVGNDDKFVSHVIQYAAKEVLKNALMTSGPIDSLFFHLVYKDTRAGLVIMKHLENTFDPLEIQQVASQVNEKGKTLLRCSLENVVEKPDQDFIEFIKFFAKYKTRWDQETILDLALSFHQISPSESTLVALEVLIQNDYTTKNFSKYFGVVSESILHALFGKLDLDSQNLEQVFEKAIQYQTISILKDLLPKITLNTSHLFIATGIKNGFDIVKYLIDSGAKIDEMNQNLESPFFNSCRIGDLNAIKYQLNITKDLIHQKNIQNRTPLNICLSHGHKSIAEYLKRDFNASAEPCHLWNFVSDDVVEYILSFLTADNYLNCKLTCHQFYSIVDGESIWQLEAIRQHGYSHNLTHDCWKTAKHVLSFRQNLERFKTSSLKSNPVLFASSHYNSNWKKVTPSDICKNISEKKTLLWLNSRMQHTEDHSAWNSEIENKSKALSKSSAFSSLPIDIEWKEIGPSELLDMMIEEGIEHSYLKMLLRSFANTMTELEKLFADPSYLLVDSPTIKTYFGVSMTKNGDEFMKQKVTGIVWNHYCFVTGDYVACLQIRQALKQKDKISYKTILKPISLPPNYK